MTILGKISASRSPWASYAAFKTWKMVQKASRKVLGVKP